MASETYWPVMRIDAVSELLRDSRRWRAAPPPRSAPPCAARLPLPVLQRALPGPRAGGGGVSSATMLVGFALAVVIVALNDSISRLLLHDPSRDFQSAEILVVGVLGVNVQIAHDRMLDPRFDAVDHVLRVDVADDPVRLSGWRLRRRTPRHDVVLRAADALGPNRGVVGRGALEEAPRRDPDLELLRPRRVGGRDVLVEVARHRGRCARNRGRHRRAEGARRRLVQVNRACVGRDRGHLQRTGARFLL